MRGGSVGEEGRGRRDGENWGLRAGCARSGLSARRGSGRGGGTALGTAGGKSPDTVLLRSITFAPMGAEETAGRLRFQSGADLDCCISWVSERDGRGHVGGGEERGRAGGGRGRLFASGRGAVRREKELGMRRSRSGLVMLDLTGLAGLAARSMLACREEGLAAARAGVGRGRRGGGAVGDVASAAEGARMAGRDGAGARCGEGSARRTGDVDGASWRVPPSERRGHVRVLEPDRLLAPVHPSAIVLGVHGVLQRRSCGERPLLVVRHRPR